MMDGSQTSEAQGMGAEAIPAVTPPAAPTPRRGPGHRADMRDTVAEMTERAQMISMEAGSKIAGAMRDVISAAAGIAGFAIESARDVVNYMVRRGQMSQEEADRLIREAEEAHGKRPEAERSRPTATKIAADKKAAAAAFAAANPPAPAPAFTPPPRPSVPAPRVVPPAAAPTPAPAPAPVAKAAAPAAKPTAPTAKPAAAPKVASAPKSAPSKAPGKSVPTAKTAPVKPAPVKPAPKQAKVAAKLPAKAAPKSSAKAPAKAVSKSAKPLAKGVAKTASRPLKAVASKSAAAKKKR